MNKAHKKRKTRKDKSHYCQQQAVACDRHKSAIYQSFDEEIAKRNSTGILDASTNSHSGEATQAFVNENKLMIIKTSETMGRYAVAARDVDPGTILIRELPLVVGPCADDPVVCLGCYLNLEKDKILVPFKCPGCSWPLCSSHCSGREKPFGHSKKECEVLSKTKNIGVGIWYSAIVPLRCLLLQESDHKAYDRLCLMESLDSIRKKCPTIWQTNQKLVVDRILTWGLDNFSEELIHRICGILEVNAFEIGQRGISIRALYPTAFLLAHECVPNTTHTDNNSYRLTIRSSMPILQNQLISLSYAYTMQSTLQRRQHLFDCKFFWCICNRCADSRELGTNVGTLICPRCGQGTVVSTSPLEVQAPWACTSNSTDCSGYTISADSVRLLMKRIGDEIERINGNDLNGYEALLYRYRNVLHPNHYHCIGVKHSLSQLYGKIDGYMIQELSVTLLERKIQLCREILSIFDVIEPGLSRLRGMTLYELHAPIMILATRDFQAKIISKPQLRDRLSEILRCLKDSANILSFEPENSAEATMTCAATNAIFRIRDWEKILGKILL